MQAEVASEPRRCFEYGSRVSVVTGLPELSVVVWLERRGAIPTSPCEMRASSWLQATWQSINIELYDLPAHDALAVFGPRRYGNDAMRALIWRLFTSAEVLDTSPLYREWVGKVQAEGMANGVSEGSARLSQRPE